MSFLSFFFYTRDSTKMAKVDIWTLRSFLLIKQCPGPSSQCDHTPRDPYTWNCRELATLLTLSESLAEVGLKPLTIGSMRKNLTIELSLHLVNE